jgi:hypothetical protein
LSARSGHCAAKLIPPALEAALVEFFPTWEELPTPLANLVLLDLDVDFG